MVCVIRTKIMSINLLATCHAEGWGACELTHACHERAAVPQPHSITCMWQAASKGLIPRAHAYKPCIKVLQVLAF